jgi:hypothetical protein
MPKGYWIGHVDVGNEEGYKPLCGGQCRYFQEIRRAICYPCWKVRVPRRQHSLAKHRCRIPRLCYCARLLPLAGIPSQHQGEAATLDR